MVWNGLRWFEMVWDGLKWFEMVLNGLRWFEMVWDGFKWFEMVSNGLRWFEMVWDGLKWFEMVWPARGEEGSEHQSGVHSPTVPASANIFCLFVCLFICKSYSENIITHAHTFLMKLPATTGYGLKEQTSSALLYHNLSSCKTEANMVWLLIIDSTINSVFQLFTHPHILPQLSRSPEHSLAPRRTLRSL